MAHLERPVVGCPWDSFFIKNNNGIKITPKTVDEDLTGYKRWISKEI